MYGWYPILHYFVVILCVRQCPLGGATFLVDERWQCYINNGDTAQCHPHKELTDSCHCSVLINYSYVSQAGNSLCGNVVQHVVKWCHSLVRQPLLLQHWSRSSSSNLKWENIATIRWLFIGVQANYHSRTAEHATIEEDPFKKNQCLF